jgi:hypothetical protein
VKTVALEEIHADPHVLDLALANGEALSVSKDGRSVAEFRPLTLEASSTVDLQAWVKEHRAWMLETWGPEAFKSTTPVEEDLKRIRRDREF